MSSASDARISWILSPASAIVAGPRLPDAAPSVPR